MKKSPQFTRRQFLKRTAATTGAVAGTQILGMPAILSAANPNSKLGVAVIGAGGMGGYSFDQAMTFFHVEDPGLKRELWRSVEGTHGTMPTAVAQRVSRAARAKITFAERHLLELLVHDGDLRDVIIPTLEHSDYEDLATAELFDAFIAIHEAKQPVVAETLVEHLGGDEETLDLAHKLLSAESKRNREDAMDEVLIEAENCVFTLRNMAIANRITELSREATLAEHSGNTERFNTLVYEQLKLEKIRRELQQRTG